MCLNDNTTADPVASELYTTPVDIPAECVRLIFSLNVISAGRVAESTHTHICEAGSDKIKATALMSASPGLMFPLGSTIPA